MKRGTSELELEEPSAKKRSVGDSEEWHRLLSETTVGDLLKLREKPLVTVAASTTVGDAMKLLSEHNILSLPVAKDNKEFLGFVDVLDIASFVLGRWKSISYTTDEINFPSEVIFDETVGHILNLSHANPTAFIVSTATLYELIKEFLDPKNYYRLHRIAVTNKEGDIINVVSQSDLVFFAYEHLDVIPEIRRDALLGDMKGLIRTPLMVRIDASFVDALECLCKNKISGLALVDHEYKLSGNISVSDLRGLNPLAFEFFNGSTLQFLFKGTDSQGKPTQSLGQGNSFGDAITRLAKERIHRLYIVSDTGHPVGFLSLIDVIARLVVPRNI